MDYVIRRGANMAARMDSPPDHRGSRRDHQQVNAAEYRDALRVHGSRTVRQRDGPTILVNEVYHLSSDANGKTTVEFYNAECIVSKN
jgi:hypothetical protein